MDLSAIVVFSADHLGLFWREHATHICCSNDYIALVVGFSAETLFMAHILVLNHVGRRVIRLLLSQSLSQKFLALLVAGMTARYFLSHIREIVVVNLQV